MSCGCGQFYSLAPGDRAYLSAAVRDLRVRVGLLEGNGVSSELSGLINTTIRSIVPSWALQPNPPQSGGVTVEADPTVPAWAKQPTKPTYTVAEIFGAASQTYVDSQVGAHTNRTDNPHNVTAAQIGAPLASALASVAFTGNYNSLINIPTALAEVDSAAATKLAGIEVGAQVNAVTSVNGMTGDVIVTPGGVPQTIVEYADVAPSDTDIKFWFKTDTGILYARYGATWVSIDTIAV